MTPPRETDAPASGDTGLSNARPAPQITVAIPTFNRCDQLRETVYALLTVGVFGTAAALIVVDDGSTDGTEQFMRELESTYEGPVSLRYHRQVNQGPAAARNWALEQCETEWIAFLDDDCVPEPGWLKALFTMIQEGGDRLAGIGGRFLPARSRTLVAHYLELRGVNEYPSRHRKFGGPLGGNCLFSRKALQAAGGYDCTYRVAASEDSDLNRRLKQLGYHFQYQPAAVVRDHNVETLGELICRGIQRGRSRVLKRALWQSSKRPTWVGAVREMLLALLWIGAILLAPVRAFRFLTVRSHWPRAIVLAAIDALAHTMSRWGRLQMSVAILLKQQPVDRKTLLSAASLAAAEPENPPRDFPEIASRPAYL